MGTVVLPNAQWEAGNQHVVVLLCGWDVAAPRGRLRPRGARESPLFGRGCYNQDIFKDPKRHDHLYDHLSVLYNKDTLGGARTDETDVYQARG